MTVVDPRPSALTPSTRNLWSTRDLLGAHRRT